MTYILCTDLDRTLIPNGIHPDDHRSIPALHSLLDEIKLTLVYVSGRDLNLVDQVIEQYKLPIPDFAITDVGSQIYQRDNSPWQINTNWQNALQSLWDETKNVMNNVYLARGAFFGLTGNYCSGILEGLAYYFPELKNTIQEQLTKQ